MQVLTSRGGSYGFGTVFKITSSGKLTTLYNFCSQAGCTDGIFPYAGVVQATNGDLFGTTSSAGGHGGGTVFKISPSGTLTTLYTFCSKGECRDGATPLTGLVQGTNGDLYGTTYLGASGGGGTIFKVTPTGKLTTLYRFCSQEGCTDGGNPDAVLLQGTNGELYGTTPIGGSNGNYGTLFSLSAGLRPFVETQTTTGEVGAAVKILGSNLTGATGISFNGTAAVFTVVSKHLITTTVPTGATTGTIQVVTPSGALSSNVPFGCCRRLCAYASGS